MNKPTILILCTGNSCRSHLAEGILKQDLGDHFQIESAGSDPAGYVHPLAVKAMAEIGIDISHHRSKNLDQFLNQEIETIITVCGNVNQCCPDFPGPAERLHLPFDDPAHAPGSEDEQLVFFRRVRDEIKAALATYATDRLKQVS